MLKIQRSSNGQVTYMLSGQMEEEDVAELEALIRSEAKGRGMVLDLKNLTLVGLGGHPKPASWGHLKTGQLKP